MAPLLSSIHAEPEGAADAPGIWRRIILVASLLLQLLHHELVL